MELRDQREREERERARKEKGEREDIIYREAKERGRRRERGKDGERNGGGHYLKAGSKTDDAKLKRAT